MHNKQDENAGNLGDVAKHAALVALGSLILERLRGDASLSWLDSHAYLLETTPRAPVEQWRRDLEGLGAAGEAVAVYRGLEEAAYARGRYLCSSGLIAALGGARVRYHLAERHEATRRKLAEQLAAQGLSPTCLLTEASAFASIGGERRGSVLALVDPLPPRRDDWPQIWTAPEHGWPGVRLALAGLAEEGGDVALLLYQWRPNDAEVVWPTVPDCLLPQPTATRVLAQGAVRHHLAVYASASMTSQTRERLAAQGW